VAIVSDQPRLFVGMLPVGFAEKRSTTVFARLFSRSSPKFSPANSSLIQGFDFFIKTPPKRRE
jgi:hypothetical protein